MSQKSVALHDCQNNGLSNNAMHLDIEGKTIQIALIRRRTANRYILRVRPSYRDVQLTMPPHGSIPTARAFVERNHIWLRSRLAKLPQPRQIQNGAILPYKGHDHRVSYHQKEICTVWIEKTESSENKMPCLCVAGAGTAICLNHILHRWLKHEAEKTLSCAAHKYAHLLNVNFARVSIRDQKTRWGSCSSSGTLTFSWRLIMAPSYVLDYLAAHEVTHLRYMDHSTTYWRILRTICPATNKAEKWLKTYGQNLHSYDILT